MSRARSAWWWFVVAICALGSGRAVAMETGVSDSRVTLPSAPGAIDGVADNARVTGNTGAMSYSVPIDLPAGFAGATPSLALVYSSFAGAGAVGLGWDMPVPAIERATARGLPHYDTTDEIAFGGSELLIALPDAGTGVAEYRARFERGFVRYRWHDRGDGTQGWWTTEDPTGSVTYYGADSQGALVASARLAGSATQGTFRYYPVETVDRLGHRLVYEWAAEALPAGASAAARTVPLLRKLSWAFVQGEPRYTVAFTYGDRARTVSDCDPGFETLLTKQLAGLTVAAGGQTRRTYSFTYEAAAASGGMARLARVESAGADGTKDPIVYSFGYTQALGVACADASCQPTLVEMPLAGVNASLRAGHTTLVDLNGDALPDIVDTTGPKHKILLSKLGSDGKASFLPVATSAFGGGYDTMSPDVQLLDVDGDGFVDMVHAQAGTMLANKGTAAGDWSSEQPLNAGAANTTLADLLMRDGPNVRFLDVDGDHRIDALRLTKTSAEVYRNAGPAGFVAQAAPAPGSVGYDFASDGVQLADMNGDGQQDLVLVTEAGLTYWLGLGFGQWGPPVVVAMTITTTEKPAVELQDLNGDQLDDVVIVQGNQVKYALNRGSGVFDDWSALTGADPRFANLPTVTQTVTVLFADMNGNGSTDVVWVDAAGKLTYLELFPLRPNLLTHADNGLGLVTEVRYGTTLEQQGRAAAPWPHRLPHAMIVVGALDKKEALGGATETELYAYTDAYYDAAYKQFRGFAQMQTVQESDPAQEASRTTADYDLGVTDPYRAGLMKKETLESATRTLYTEAHEYDDCAVDGVTADSGVRFVCEKARTRTLIEGRATGEWVTTETHFDYDKNGNVALESHLGVTAVGGGGCGACAGGPAGLTNGPCGPTCAGDEVTVERQYVAPSRALGGWILPAVAVEKTTGSTPGLAHETRTYYDGDAFVGLALGKVDKGLVTRVEVVANAAGATQQLERNRLDADGNVVETLDPLGAPGGDDHRRAYAYDPAGLRVVAASAFTKDATGPYELRQTFAYDALWDAVSEASDWALVRGGQTTAAPGTRRYAYDGLGRLVAQAETPSTLDAPDETLTYETGAPPSRVIMRRRSRAGGPLDLEMVRCFDGKGRAYEERTLVAEGRFRVSGFTTFNVRDAVVSEGQPYEATTDACDKAAPAGTRVTSYLRDAAERVVRTTLSDGDLFPQASTTRTDFGPLTVVFHGLNAGTQETRAYDGLGHLVSTERAGDNVRAQVHRFWYDGLARLGAVANPEGNLRTQSYDGLGQPVRVSDADSGETRLEYDALGNRTRREDGRGTATLYSYDGLGRLQAEWAEGNEASTRVDYTYDVAPASCMGDRCANVVGRLAAIAYPLGTGHGAETYGYDARGRQTRFGRTFASAAASGEATAPNLGAQSFDFTVTYDNVARVVGADYPGGLHVAYELDGVDHVTKVPDLLDAVTYTARGDTRDIKFANGVTTTFDVDGAGQLAGIHTSDKAAAPLVALTYERDREGQILKVHDQAPQAGVPSAEATFAYDPFERLVTATLDAARPTSPFAETLTYGYDSSAELVSRTSSRDTASPAHLGTFSFDPARPHRLARAGSLDFRSDTAGNTAMRGGDAYGWDHAGRLKNVIRGDQPGDEVAAYFYGSTRNRIVKVENGHRVFALTSDFDVRDGHGVFYLRLGGQLMAKVETPALATTVLSDVAPATLAGAAATPEPDGAITAGDAWLAQAAATKTLTLAGQAPSDVDALLASATRGLLAGSATKKTFLHVDHEGSVVAATDETGALAFNAAYYPHGDVRWAYGAAPEDVRFTGKERDEASELTSFGNRYADLATGRWLSPDPGYELLIDPDALERPDEATSRYTFARGNPVNQVDRDGRAPWLAIGAVIGGVTSFCAEVYRQHAIEKVGWTNWRMYNKSMLAFKTLSGAGWGALSAGLSAVSTIASVKAEVYTYKKLSRSKVAETNRPLTAHEDHAIRLKAAVAGVAAGFFTGLAAGAIQAPIETAILDRWPDADLSHPTSEAFSTQVPHIAEVVASPFAELAPEGAEVVHDFVRKRQDASVATRARANAIGGPRISRPRSTSASKLVIHPLRRQSASVGR